MSKGTYEEFRDALRAFESGWDRDRYEAGVIADWQLDQWAGGSVTDFYPTYSSWSELSDAEWDAMSYRSMNSLGFVGYQFGEALLIDLGYYEDDQFYGNGAATNTWDGTWTGKNGVTSLEDFMTKAAQEQAIQEAFGYNLQVIENGLAQSGQSLDDFIGTTTTYVDNGQTVTVELTMTGILAAAHLRGAWGTLALLQNGAVSQDEYGTSILRYIDQFGGFDAPTSDQIIAVFTDGTPVPDGDGPDGEPDGDSDGDPDQPSEDTGGSGDQGDVYIDWAWGQTVTVPFDPASDVIHIAWIGAADLAVYDGPDGAVFAIPSNSQATTLDGVYLADLSPANFDILDSGTEAMVLNLIGDAAPDGEGNGHGDGEQGDTGHGDGGHGDGDPDNGGHDHQHVMIGLGTDGQIITDFMPAMGDMIEIGPDVYAENFNIFEESGDALGQTVRIEIINGSVTTQVVFTGFGLEDLSLANISAANEGVQNEIAAALGTVIVSPGDGGGYTLTYDADGSNPPATNGPTEAGGVTYVADSNADDIVGFDPDRDALDFGGTSVHGMIVTKSEAGEIVIDSPWSDAAQIVQGVTYQDVTIDTFGIVGNEHFRQDMGGVVSWEQGIGPRDADTVYLRSHEYGVHEVVDGFDPTSMKLSLLYFGTRERLSVEDSEDGLVISSLPSGQSLTLTGVQKTDLIPGMVEFHFDQVMEDNLEVAFGFDQNDVTLVDRTVLLTPAAPAGATTDGFQTRTGDLTGSIYDGDDNTGDDNTGGDTSGGDDTGGDEGEDAVPPIGEVGPADVVTFSDGVAESYTLGWSYGTTTTIEGFNPGEDVFDFGSLSGEQVGVTEQNGDLIFEVLGNGGDFVVLSGLQVVDLQPESLTAPSWSTTLEDDSPLMQALVSLGYSDAV